MKLLIDRSVVFFTVLFSTGVAHAMMPEISPSSFLSLISMIGGGWVLFRYRQYSSARSNKS